ncbi:MAG: family 20 glycosylhydrolase [Rikenellaceae bacterium]
MNKFSALLLSLSALILFNSCCSDQTKSYNEGVNILPIPKEMTLTEGRFTLNKQSTIVVTATGGDIESVATFFAAKMSKSTGFDIKVVAGEMTAGNIIILTIDAGSEIEKEGYSLRVTPERVEVIASTAQGLFYGMQSFMQLLPAEIESLTKVSGIEWSAQALDINDAPRFEYRGMMLDVCRHFSTVEEVKRHIDILSMFKINTLHWHLTEDQLWTVEIKKYPKLTELGSNRLEGEGNYHSGFYTQEQLKEVVKYASDRFITIVPEIEMPGHALAALTAYPEFSCAGGPFQIRNVWGVEADVYCAGLESTFEFLEDVLEELIPIFPGEYIHVGGDECPKDRWDECPRCLARMKKEGLKDSHELQSYFITRMEKFINSKGKKLIGWDEILEGGLAPNAAVMSWRGEDGGIAAANSGHNVVMTPNSHIYLDHYQGATNVESVTIGGNTLLSRTYSYDPIPKNIDDDKKHFVIGVQGNVWTEYMYSHSLREYMAYPRMLAVAEIGWSPLDKKDFEDFNRRLSNAYVRMDALDVNYHIPLPEGPSADYIAYLDSAKLEFTNSRNYPMVYTTDGSTPNSKSTQYSSTIVLTKDATINIATLLPSGKTSKVRQIKVTKEELSPAFEGETKPGVVSSTAKGHYLESKDYADAKFEDEKQTDYFVRFGSEAYKEPSIVVTEGYFEVDSDGVYVLATDNAELYVDGRLIVDNNNQVSRFQARPSTMALAKGKHHFKLVMNNSVVGGWPNVWSSHTFYIQSPAQTSLKQVDKNQLSHAL